MDRIKAHIRVPAWCFGGRDGQAIERFDQPEHAGHDSGFGQIVFNFLFGKRITRHAQLFRSVGDVPRVEFGHAQFRTREIVEFLQIAFSIGLGAQREFIQKIDHLFRRFRHLGFERIFGVVVKAQQLRKFAAQLDDICDQRRVIELRFAEFRCARRRGTVHPFAKRAIIGILHHRQIRGRVQCKFPSGFFVGFGSRARGRTRVIRNA